MKFKTRNWGTGSVVEDNLAGVIDTAHLFAYNEREKTDVILTVLAALANNLPTEAQVALAKQLGFEAVEEDNGN